MSRTRSKKKKGRGTTPDKPVTPKKGKQKTHVRRDDKGDKKAPPWLMPLLAFVGLAVVVALAIVAASATQGK